MIRAVLLDATGTLMALRGSVGEAYARAARAQGLQISAWRLDDAFRRALEQAPPMVFPAAPRQERPALERRWWRERVRVTFLSADSSQRLPDFDACFDRLWAHFSAPEAWQRREGAVALLESLRARGLRTAIVSNFDARLPSILAGLGLAERLDAIVLPCTAGAAKPDPAIFRCALETLRVAPQEALFVGDDAERDLDGARRAGLRAVHVGSLATLDALEIPGGGET